MSDAKVRIEKLKIKQMSASEFERVLGVAWPL